MLRSAASIAAGSMSQRRRGRAGAGSAPAPWLRAALPQPAASVDHRHQCHGKRVVVRNFIVWLPFHGCATEMMR